MQKRGNVFYIPSKKYSQQGYGGIQQLIHYNKVAKTACKHKEMENLMGTEIFVQTVKHRKFAGINDAANGIKDTAGKEPVKRRLWHGGNNVRKGKNAKPAHCNI